ncbi:hypothetical protein [Sphingomonas phyllosphaerae]|uniref:hypothetical protein n=1 Tax=Sphingomonas phyllosphaerae TaxID=257003 RepID=UPI0003B6EC5D|nr:hypothetical protein [Sphingomonas phyllosphaerae]
MSALDRIKQLPDWPARMTAPVAAAYMGISASTFLTRFRAQGVREGANLLWARVQLDRIIEEQFGLAAARQTSACRDTSWNDFD